MDELEALRMPGSKGVEFGPGGVTEGGGTIGHEVIRTVRVNGCLLARPRAACCVVLCYANSVWVMGS
jgi:hypothetical protein